MRIVLISQDDPFYIKEFFEPFLAGCPEEIEIRAAVLCRTMGKSRRTLAAELWRFYGPIDFVRMGLRYTWILMRAAVARKRPVRLPQLFEHHGIPVIETLNVNGRKLREQLETIGPDLIVSVAAPQVFSCSSCRGWAASTSTRRGCRSTGV